MLPRFRPHQQRPRRPQRARDRGQASLEWLAIVTLVSTLFALGAGLAQADAVGRRITREMARALCIVRDGDCQRDHEPCIVGADGDRSTLKGGVLFVRLGYDRYALLERRSDGTYAVTIDNGGSAGLAAEAGLKAGAHFGKVGVTVGGTVTASIIARLAGGRTWIAGTEAEAREILSSGGASRPPDLTTTEKSVLAKIGVSVGLDGSVETVSSKNGGTATEQDGAAKQDAATNGDATKEETGKILDLPDLDLASGELSFSQNVSSTTDHRTGKRTIYVSADVTASAKALVLGSAETHDAQEVYAVELSATGRPLALTIMATGALSGSRDLPAIVQPVAGRLPAAGANRYEVTAALDLTEPAALAAASGLFDAIVHKRGRAQPSAALRRLIESRGTVEARILASKDETTFTAGANATIEEVSLSLDATFEHHADRLLAAASRGLDGQWIAREDCV